MAVWGDVSEGRAPSGDAVKALGQGKSPKELGTQGQDRDPEMEARSWLGLKGRAEKSI